MIAPNRPRRALAATVLWAHLALPAAAGQHASAPHDRELLNQVQRTLKAARLNLMIKRPFYGSLVTRLPLVLGHCRRAATDARAIYVNPPWIATLRPKQVEFVLAHEVLHCALLHFARQAGRQQKRWNHAGDYAINGLLIKDGLQGLDDMLFDKAFDGMSTERIYARLPEEPTGSNFDEHFYDGDPSPSNRDKAASDPGQGDQGQDDPTTGKRGGNDQRRGDPAGKNDPQGSGPPGDPTADPRSSAQTAGGKPDNSAKPGQGPPRPLTPKEREQLADAWRKRVVQAAQDARQQGHLPAELQRVVDELLAPEIPWQAVLQRYLQQVQKNDYSFARGTRRPGPMILPRLHSYGIDVVVFIDTSGSITPGELQRFVSEVNAIKGQRGARVTLHAADAGLDKNGPWVFEPWQPCELTQVKFSGGGGTSFIPAFKWIDKQPLRPDLVIYLTDAEGKFPAHAPSYPVLWVVKGDAEVPWGGRAQLQEDQR